MQSEEEQNVIATTIARPVNTTITNTAPEIIPYDQINVAYEDIVLCSEKKAEWQQRWTDLFTK